ncbi:MAG: Rrf2 family transcriptional regulator [Deltaproteobacteria bacterium RBG_19FT_COMBO_46_12]|nr:MAG: Rrf2 family transcriptional regulator [Deltaproteobacteria bacterium RBG_19FT_COMBO_46_12]
MRLSTKSRYGVRAIFDIAYHCEGLETQVKDISRRQEISPRYIEQIFQKLKKSGIIDSKRGPTGGYFLVKRPDEITVGEIIRVTEGGIDPVLCLDPEDTDQSCARSKECVTRIIWNEAGNRLKEYFDSVTIRDLCEKAQEMGIKKELDQRFTYYI